MPNPYLPKIYEKVLADYNKGLNFRVISEADHEVEVTSKQSVTGDIEIPAIAMNGRARYSVTKIDERTFYYCSDLTSVTIPDAVTEIGKSAFAFCRSLTSVTIPDAVTEICEGTFSGCSSLTSVNIPDAVTVIGESAFSGCSSLTSVTIPDAVTEIGKSAFSGCSSLTSVNIPDAVTEICEGTFYCCRSLISVNIPDAVTVIGERAFFECSSLTSVSIPDSVTVIGKYAFEFSGLTSVAIPNSVTVIGERTFYGCGSLTSVTIPNSVTVYGNGAFSGCSSLIEILVEDGNGCFTSDNGVLFDFDKTKILQYPGGKAGEYAIPNTVTEIDGYAFAGCGSLTSVTIPNSVTEIGDWAFAFCSSLTSVSIPNSVTVIEERTFNGCSSLTLVFIPNSVTVIGPYAFAGCELTSVTIPDSVIEIGDFAFASCELTSVTIPNSVTVISKNAFEYCISLTSVVIPNSVTEIGYHAFANCCNLAAIYNLNPTPQNLGYDSFRGVPENAIVYIPKGSLKQYSETSDWKYFFTDFREMGAFDVTLSTESIEMTVGKTAEISAAIEKDSDMTVKSEEWSSLNPAVATVENGVITAVAPGETKIYFTAVDGYGVPHTGTCKVTVAEDSSVDSLAVDSNAPVEVYDLSGVKVADTPGSLPAGLYIVRQGSVSKKVVVK